MAIKKEPKTHEIKIEKQYYDAIKAGKKPFEIRKNDRDYKKGDILKMILIDESPVVECELWIETQITYLLTTAPGLKKDYCLFAFSTPSFCKRRNNEKLAGGTHK